MFHGGSHDAPAPAAKPGPSTTVTTRDGRVIDLSRVRSGVATTPAPPAPAATAGATTISSGPADSDPASTAAATTAGGSNAIANTSITPAGDIGRFEDTHGKSGATKPLPVPVRGSQGLQKRLGAMADCQGPEYATLTGKTRSDYAKRCAKAGVTLSP